MVRNLSKDLNLRPQDEIIVYSIINYIYSCDTEVLKLRELGQAEYVKSKEHVVGKLNSMFNLPDLCEDSIYGYLGSIDMYKLACTNIANFKKQFPFECSRKYVLNKILWSIVDTNLERVYDCKGIGCDSNDIYSVFRTTNHLRKGYLDAIPSVGFMLYSRYRYSLEPLLCLQAVLFRAEVIERIVFSAIKSGYRRCSFGMQCNCGVVVLLMLSQGANNFFMGEFVFCREHIDELKRNIKLF